jgi:hypothetical protein
MSLICKIFGHRFITHNIAEENTCKRCGFVRPAIKWPDSILTEVTDYPPMPIIKKAKEPPANFNVQLLAELTEIKQALKKIESNTQTYTTWTRLNFALSAVVSSVN